MRILLGRIAAAHGTRGEVVIETYTEPPENICAYGPLTDETGARAFEIDLQRVTARGVVVRLMGVADRSAAEALRGVNLYVRRDRLPPPAAEEFYYADLVGLATVNAEGGAIGEIVAVHNYGAGDLLEVRLAQCAVSELIPFSEAFVLEVDLSHQRAVIILPSAQA